MEVDAFTALLGIEQGRLQRLPGDGGDGEALFVLGSRVARDHELSAGDWVQVEQEMDVTDDTILALSGTVTVGGEGSDAAEWEVAILVDDQPRAVLRARTGQTRPLSDLAVNLTRYAGVHTVGVRLTLVRQGGA